uniref:Maturase K n=2 Tax=Adenogramma TaxID=169518 RepID=E8ZBF0_9CARY|nr:maturase K [Adenogramma glomerata]CBL95119.1 maturase K [Adenogramma glomerata]CBL95121.1 maturase K [Adenogramma glomerata]CBL95122.1 maturase K [Adenogramma mollugo]
MEEFPRYRELNRYWQQHNFCYPLLFQEYIYAFAYDHGCKNSIFFQNAGEKEYSFLMVKHLITRLYNQNHLILSANESKENEIFGYKDTKNLYSQIIIEGFSVILEIPLSPLIISSLEAKDKGIVNCLEEKENFNSRNLRSIHAIFPFFEDKFFHLTYVVDILIPYPIHLEILVQTLRYWVKDASALHFLRYFLYECRNFNIFNSPKKSISFVYNSKGKQRLFFFLHNFYVWEHDSLFLFLQTQSSHFRSISFGALLERILFYGKLEYLVKVFPLTKDFGLILWLFKDPFTHYVRYRGKSLLSSKGTALLIQKWKNYLLYLWQCRFSVWSQPRRIYINRFSKYSLNFMGFLSSMRLHSFLIRSQMLENSFLIDDSRKKLDTLVRVLALVESLEKLKICNGLGHPLSQSMWTELSDSHILDQFGRIYRKLSQYYSGSSRKRSLYRIKYIIRLSCARTLARKHKRPVRVFLKRLGSELLEDFFQEEEEKFLSLIFPKKRGPIWYLDIISINHLAMND